MLFLGDLFVFVGGLFIALGIRFESIPNATIVRDHLTSFSGIFILWLAVFLIAGLYDTKVNFSRKLIPGIVLRAQSINMALAGLVFFVFPVGLTPKITLVIYLTVTTVLIMSWRLFLFPFLATVRTERALIVGGGEEAVALAHILNGGRFFRFAGASIVDPNHFENQHTFKQALVKNITEFQVSMIVGDMHNERASALVPLFYDLTFKDQHVAFLSLHQLYEQIFHRIPLSLIKESWVLENISRVPHTIDDLLKRVTDIVGAVVLGMLSLPVYPFIMLAIKSEDGGPIFYKTERIGRYNKSISIFKFRSMNGQDSGEDALKSGLHVTRVGRFLRKTRLDEIPQFYNILRGDLSFIGPRPEMPALAAVYAERIPYYTMRHMIKPGLSGWAQINDFEVPRSGVDVERTIAKLSFDLYYLKQRSFFLDIEIALKTLKTLLVRSGT